MNDSKGRRSGAKPRGATFGFLALFRAQGHCAAQLALLACLALAGCTSRRDTFLADRALDKCDGVWPVCDTVAGCLLGDRSYVEGRFPGSGKVGVQVFEPSTVRVSIFLDEVGSTGEETVIHFFEDRCRARHREAITGRTFVGEAEQVGWVSREADLVGTGDHLISFESDAKARYLLKVDVIPKRVQ